MYYKHFFGYLNTIEAHSVLQVGCLFVSFGMLADWSNLLGWSSKKIENNEPIYKQKKPQKVTRKAFDEKS